MTKKSFSSTREQEIADEQNRFIIKVFGWMSLALIITGFISMWTASNPALVEIIIGNQIVFIGLLVLQFILVAILVSVVKKISAQLATLIFILYAVLNGVTLSAIFIVFTKESLATTFFITAGTFGVMSLYGYFTKSDLTKHEGLMFMGLIGLIIASIVNLIFHNEMLYWITTYVGVLVFVGLIAYDTQKLKKMNVVGNEGTETDKKEAIMGALSLYLDFINLFLYLLRIFGKRK